MSTSMSGHGLAGESLSCLGGKDMTIEQVLHEYRTLATQATELRTTLKSIRDQLTRGGTPDWLHRANRAYDFKAQQLRQVKEEMKAYRAVLRTKELID